MIDNGYLFAKDNKRLFINPSIGCTSKCQYCYLPKLGIKDVKRKTFKEIIEMLEKSNYKLSKNTLITLGCFSECFDELNKEETLKIIEYFLKKGNQIQISTKRQILYNDIKNLIPLIKYYGQLTIYISSSTKTHYEQYEKGTEPLDSRFKTFDLINYNIPVVLYIKPVIQNITIQDIELYKKLITEKGISHVVVGSLFTEDKNTESAPFTSTDKLFYTKCIDEELITKELTSVTKVWQRSTEVIKYLKNNFQIIAKVQKEVNKLLKEDKSGHNMEHINRVYNMSLKFAHYENADEFIVSLIALLHEVDDYKLFGEENANSLPNAKKIMQKEKIDYVVQEKVLDLIKTIGYKKSLKGIRPNSIEGMVVSDADMCDGIGVTGILRTYDYQKSHGKPFLDKNIFPTSKVDATTYKIYDDSVVCHCFNKLLRLKNLMMTNSGRKEATNRHNIIVSILYNLFEEENIPEWTEYLNNFLNNNK